MSVVSISISNGIRATCFIWVRTRSGEYAEFTLLRTAMGALRGRFVLPSCGQGIHVGGLVAGHPISLVRIEARISQDLWRRIGCLRRHMTSVWLLRQSRGGSERF